jgi:2-methylcitrate dehydratase PrpD
MRRPLLATLPALAEHRGSSGRELIDALVRGIDVSCRMGSVVHPAIEACTRLRDQGVDAQQTQRIELQVHRLVLELTGKKEPADGLAAKFSVCHGAAVGLIFGRAGEAEYVDAIVGRGDVVALRRKVAARVDERIAEDAVVAVATLIDGRQLRLAVDHAIGSTARPLPDAALDAKFHDLVDPVLGAPRATG